MRKTPEKKEEPDQPAGSEPDESVSDGSDSVRRRCFIVTPMGPANSGVRRAADGVIEAAIAPVLRDLEFEVINPLKMNDPGSITQAVIKHLLNVELVIANLTGLNPNVMYEVAVRHCKGRPIVFLAEEGTKVPFDLTDDRIVFYENDMSGTVELKSNLRDTIDSALKKQNSENAVTRAAQSTVISEIAKPDSAESAMLMKLDYIETALSRLMRRTQAPSTPVEPPPADYGYELAVDIEEYRIPAFQVRLETIKGIKGHNIYLPSNYTADGAKGLPRTPAFPRTDRQVWRMEIRSDRPLEFEDIARIADKCGGKLLTFSELTL